MANVNNNATVQGQWNHNPDGCQFRAQAINYIAERLANGAQQPPNETLTRIVENKVAQAINDNIQQQIHCTCVNCETGPDVPTT